MIDRGGQSVDIFWKFPVFQICVLAEYINFHSKMFTYQIEGNLEFNNKNSIKISELQKKVMLISVEHTNTNRFE